MSEVNVDENIIRSKGLFWLVSRLGQALIWSQAGGSLKADNTGVWWSSMPFRERTQFASFIENQEMIEENWHPIFGDKKNEIVFIGQNLDEEQIRQELNKCLSYDEELTDQLWKSGEDDKWPIQRTHPVGLEEE